MIGEQIGNFKIMSQLGKGGMGEVYLGEHHDIGTRVAVKMLLPHVSVNKEQVDRFFNEAIAVSKIHHAGTAKIFDVGFHTSGRAYLIMEFLPGETLAARIRRLGKLPLAAACEIGKQVSGVLEAVHKAGITHRDLKPDNIFVVPDDELASGERVKIVDFGIAKLSGAGGGMTATSSGSMGTPAYMSPEQWKNTKNVDWRADVYSLGCLSFEMIVGRPPFIAQTIGEACSMHLTEEPPRLASVMAVPPPLDALIASMLEKSPAQRPPSMREIANAFGAIGATVTPVHLAATQLSGQIAIGATLPVAGSGATQATGGPIANLPTQATGGPIANLPTQATGAPNANLPTQATGGPIANLPTQATGASIAPPPPEPPKHVTTIGGATGESLPKPRTDRTLVMAAGGLAAVGIALVITFAVVRGRHDPPVEPVALDLPSTTTTSVTCNDPSVPRWKCFMEAAARVTDHATAATLYGEALAACTTDDKCGDPMVARITKLRDESAAKANGSAAVASQTTEIDDRGTSTTTTTTREPDGTTRSQRGSASSEGSGRIVERTPISSGSATDHTNAAVPKVGFLTIRSKRRGMIYIDGKLLDDTSVGRLAVPAGRHAVRVSAAGYQWEGAITIVEGEHLEREVELVAVGKVGGESVANTAACDRVSCELNNFPGACCQKFKPQVESLDRAQIREGIKKIEGRVFACGPKHDAHGKIYVSIEINADGSVRDVQINPSLSTAFDACVIAALKTARFATSKFGGRMIYPFTF